MSLEFDNLEIPKLPDNELRALRFKGEVGDYAETLRQNTTYALPNIRMLDSTDYSEREGPQGSFFQALLDQGTYLVEVSFDYFITIESIHKAALYVKQLAKKYQGETWNYEEKEQDHVSTEVKKAVSLVESLITIPLEENQYMRIARNVYSAQRWYQFR